MFQSMLKSLRSSRMISVISALFSQTLNWLSFIAGYTKGGVKKHIERRSAVIEPKVAVKTRISQFRESQSQIILRSQLR
eukprot:6129953-Amphidinium_carterae.1